jgi:hypothetical protein
MPNVRDAGQQLKTALDKIAASKNNPDQVQAAVNEAKQKVDQLVQSAEQA